MFHYFILYVLVFALPNLYALLETSLQIVWTTLNTALWCVYENSINNLVLVHLHLQQIQNRHEMEVQWYVWAKSFHPNTRKDKMMVLDQMKKNYKGIAIAWVQGQRVLLYIPGNKL